MSKEKRIVPQSERYSRWGYAFITPWIIGFLVFTFLPMLFSMYLSFTDYDTINTPRWVGFQNFVKMFTKAEMWHSLWITVKFGVIALPLGIITGFLLAYLLNQKIPAMKFWHNLDTVVMDKTGTITEGRPVVTDVLLPYGTAEESNPGFTELQTAAVFYLHPPACPVRC